MSAWAHPKHPPSQDAEDSNEVHKAPGSSQPCLFGFATGFQDLLEALDLPAHGLPVQLRDGIVVGMHGAGWISFQPIFGRCFGSSRSWRTAREVERGIALLFADRRQDMDPAVYDLDRDLDLMQPADLFSFISAAIMCSPSPARRSTQWLKSSAAGARPNSPVSRTRQTDRRCRLSDVVMMDGWSST